jgi:hypothetical protein
MTQCKYFLPVYDHSQEKQTNESTRGSGTCCNVHTTPKRQLKKNSAPADIIYRNREPHGRIED